MMLGLIRPLVGLNLRGANRVCVSLPERLTVKDMKVWTQEGQMFVEWKQPNNTAVTEYVIEWVSHGKRDWQRENRSTRTTVIKEVFFSVHPQIKTGPSQGQNTQTQAGWHG
ncbi:hypothetical protein CHARACLAT_017838 [Characodon lateralis]|uniref:Uncharacterized protein n=1 Tax=Characodon lateralis TaxID=208331 RepID=A0ABU7EN83_9TELE|nr:hypothetical protein [Characodon lateralis]